MYKTLFFCIFSGITFLSCQKQSGINGNALLFLSSDSVYFDTVFTTSGSITQQVKLINNYNQAIGISSISLAGGSASPFVINIDGSPGPDAFNLSVPGDDSLYIFIAVSVKPSANPTPFILRDSIRINYNGVNQYIKLSAWGQNAHFLTNQTIAGNTTWPNDLPYIINGGLTIDSNATLNIQPGVRIYLHANAPIYIDGTLQVNGIDSQQVYFTGDRLDQPYVNYPGSWPGIYFTASSRNNVMNYANVQNASHSLVVQGLTPDLSPKLILNQCIINNSANEGILAFQTGIVAINCLISNCSQNIVIGQGGAYKFEYCTVASYSTDYISHQNPVLTVSNAASDGSQILTGDLNCSFTNCIFWGGQNIMDEAEISKEGNTLFNVLFDHSILKQVNYPANIDSSSLFLNTDPLFISTAPAYNFQVQAGSPALDQGKDIGVSIDLLGDPRPAALSDLGSYERQH